jgi:DNA ligase-1
MVDVSFKPMLAAKSPGNLDTLALPVLGSPKYDGVRALVLGGVVYSRNLKPIPNKSVQRLFGHRKYNGLDGELIVGSPTAVDVFRNTTSYVMSENIERIEPKDDVKFYVFDDFTKANDPYKLRFEQAKNKARHTTNVIPVPTRTLNSKADIDDLEDWCLAMGYEGAMLRTPNGPYKFGRATTREGYLSKFKRFEDSEAKVVGWVEREHNGNEATRDELGRSKRSSHKAGKVATGTLGALEVVDVHTGVAFAIGTGFDDVLRAALWAGGLEAVVGRIVKYTYFPTGSKTKPRFPVFHGFRDPRDM